MPSSTLQPRLMPTAACSVSRPSRPRLAAIGLWFRWLASFGVIEKIGVEGTGSYGAGLARHLTGKGITVNPYELQ